MTRPSFDYIIGVKFVLTGRVSGSKTIWVTTRPNLGTTLSTYPYWPIILSVSELGIELDEYLPRQATGSIVLDNSSGSVGFGRKFSDYLQRYTIIDQDVEVYLKALAIGTGSFSFASDDKVWAGKVETARCESSDNGATITINVRMDLIDDRLVGFGIDSTQTVFADAPATSLGKWLPVMVGSGTCVPAFRITSDTASIAYFAVAANFADTFIHNMAYAVANKYIYSQDVDGEWVPVEYDSSAYTYGTGTTRDLTASDEVIYQIPNSASANLLTIGASVRMYPRGGGSDTSTAQLQLTLYEYDSENVIGRALTSGSISLTDYDADNNAGSTFWVYTTWPRAVLLNYDRFSYAIGIRVQNYAITDADICVAQTDTCKRWLKTQFGGDMPVYDGVQAAGIVVPLRSYLDDYVTTTSVNGWRASCFSLSESASYYPQDSWTSCTFMVDAAGLLDDSSGTITGTPSAALTRPDRFLQAITRVWSGSAWDDSGNWDWSTLAATYAICYASTGRRTRLLSGATVGATTLFDIVTAICRDTASRIGVTNAGKLFIWPWGELSTVADVIPAHHILVLDRQHADPSSIVNHVIVNYGQTALNSSWDRNATNRRTSDYNGTLDWQYSTTDAGLTYNQGYYSQTAYGERLLEQPDTQWINSSTAAQTLAESILTRFTHPTILDTLRVPYAEYSTLKTLDVIQYKHPDLDTFYGAWPEDNEPIEDGYDDTVAGNLWEGHNPARCQTYRGQIEGRFIEFNGAAAPTLRLVVRVLQNYPTDPT